MGRGEWGDWDGKWWGEIGCYNRELMVVLMGNCWVF